MPLRAILFDKDGTLVDFALTWNGATASVIAELAAGDAETARRLADVVHFDIETARILPTSPFIAGSIAELFPLWAAILQAEADDGFQQRITTLFHHGALEFAAPIGDPLRILSGLKRAGFRLGIVTNDSEAGARAQAEKLGIADLFDAVFGYDSGHGRKPDPGPILEFMRRFDLTAEETALVGDTLHDLDAARAAGVVSIGVASGFLAADALAPHADHVIASIMDLPDLLRRLDRAGR